MTFRNPVQFVTIASGSVVSSIADLRGSEGHFAMFLPSSLGAETFLQVSWDTVSANFVRAQLRDGSGDWSVSSPGNVSRAVTLEEIAVPFPQARAEVGSAATDTRTFAFVSKR